MITVIENSSVTVDMRPYLQSRGWSIEPNNRIKHVSDNSGYFDILSYNIIAEEEYTLSLEIDSLDNGTVVVEASGTPVLEISQVGYHQVDFTAINSGNLQLWSDADTVIYNINIQRKLTDEYEQQTGKENTLTWSEYRKGWVSFKDMIPESGFSMYTNLFTLKNGNLWMHSTTATPNLIYGVQYHSTVKFPVSSISVKTYHSISIHSNKVIGTTEDGITTQLGNVADLITYDFTTSSDGVHYANKLRDALLNEKLKGRYIVVELSDEETSNQKLQLFKVVIKGEISSPNE